MATLLSLPTEVLIDIFIASPTTRTLLHLSRANRRMRSVWLEHSHHIVLAKYKPRIPHIEQAIVLTALEAECAEVPSILENDHNIQSKTAAKAALESPPLRLCLPQILRNAGLAQSVCDAFMKDTTLQEIPWHGGSPQAEILRVYYLMRHAALAYEHPRYRPAVISALMKSSYDMLVANSHVFFFFEGMASISLRRAHGLYERNWDAWYGTDRDPDKDRYKLADRWRAVGKVFSRAEYYNEIGSEDTPSFDISEYDIDYE